MPRLSIEDSSSPWQSPLLVVFSALVVLHRVCAALCCVHARVQVRAQSCSGLTKVDPPPGAHLALFACSSLIMQRADFRLIEG
eukprot:1153605-Pelagomonas_calceolata.AAC.3